MARTSEKVELKRLLYSAIVACNHLASALRGGGINPQTVTTAEGRYALMERGHEWYEMHAAWTLLWTVAAGELAGLLEDFPRQSQAVAVWEECKQLIETRLAEACCA